MCGRVSVSLCHYVVLAGLLTHLVLPPSRTGIKGPEHHAEPALCYPLTCMVVSMANSLGVGSTERL